MYKKVRGLVRTSWTLIIYMTVSWDLLPTPHFSELPGQAAMLEIKQEGISNFEILFMSLLE